MYELLVPYLKVRVCLALSHKQEGEYHDIRATISTSRLKETVFIPMAQLE
jgi:hypothetical protein